jgi:hypothetical protein
MNRVNHGACRNCGRPVLYQGAEFCSPACQTAIYSPQAIVREPFTFDTETSLITRGRLAPPLACVSWSMQHQLRNLVHVSESRELVVQALNSDMVLSAFNAAFDFVVFCAKWPDLIPLVFEVYWADRVSDPMLREKLKDIAEGTYQWGTDEEDGERTRLLYNLEDIAYRRCRIKLEKENSWRLRYGELIETPLSFWPQEARDYAELDSVACREVWLDQEHENTERGVDYFEDEFRQSRAYFWLHLMGCWGFHTNPADVREFARKTQQNYERLRDELLESGIVKERRTKKRDGTVEVSYVKKKAPVQALIVAEKKEKGQKIPITKKAEKKLEILEEALERESVPARRASLERKIAKCASSVVTDKDVCSRADHPLLKKYAEFSHYEHMLKSDVPLLKMGTEFPIQAKFDLANSGRTKGSIHFGKGNTQNWSTSNGMRECVMPRPGHVFVVGDYAGFELRTWSQVCLWMFGQTRMGQMLNEGLDPHLEMAAQILHISYEEAKADFAQNPKGRIYLPRQTGKVCFHPETEVLTRNGWIRIDQLTGQEEVCSARLSDDGGCELEWERPLHLTTRDFDGELVHVKNEGIDLRVTPDHRMCGWKRVSYRDGRVRDYVVTCLPQEMSDLRYWPNAGMAAGKYSVDERMLRLAVAVQADGHYPEYGPVRLGFTKKRKIDRLRSLLREDEFRFAYVGAQQVSTFYLEENVDRFVRSLLTPNKKMPWWWTELLPELRTAVLEEVRFWDAHTFPRGTGYKYTSVGEENVDVLQAIATLTLSKSRKTRYAREAPLQDAFNLSVKNKHRSRGGNLEISNERYFGQVFCLTTRNDTVVVRDGGVPVITRQCDFGLPGGLGPLKLIDYGRKNYNVIIEPDESYRLKKFWLNAWPEAQLYLDRMGEIIHSGQKQVKYFMSNRYRGDLNFTELSNGWFQALAADAAKAAGFLIARACYAQPESVLYGSRPVMFIHDEFVTEVLDDEYAHDKAVEQARLMELGASPFLPDIPPVVDPMIGRRWSKSMKAVKDQNGRLVAWDLG